MRILNLLPGCHTNSKIRTPVGGISASASTKPRHIGNPADALALINPTFTVFMGEIIQTPCR